MSAPTLLPCPFCGAEIDESNVEFGGDGDGEPTTAHVECECTARGPSITGEDLGGGAIAAWNDRAKGGAP